MDKPIRFDIHMDDIDGNVFDGLRARGRVSWILRQIAHRLDNGVDAEKYVNVTDTTGKVICRYRLTGEVQS